jgi:DNA-binding NarL/FixJ family response regulator
VNTVRKHVVNIYEKLQVHNKLEAVQKAKNNRLI